MILIIFYSLIFSVISFKQFEAFNLLTNDIIIISDEGIIKYDLQLGTQSLIIPNNSTFYFERISFAHFPQNEGGYIICRIHNIVYLLSQDTSIIYGNITIPDIEFLQINIVPYTKEDGRPCIIFCYVRHSYQISIEMYEINFFSFKDSQKINQFNQFLQYSNGTSAYLSNFYLSCDIMSSENDKKILVCFFVNDKASVEVAAFDQENDLSLLYFFANEEKETKIINLNGINSISKDKYLICYINEEFNFKCLLYYSNKKWSQTVLFFENCKDTNYHKGILSSNGDEYLVYCYTDFDYLKMIKLDENFIAKDTNEEEKCFFDYKIEGCSVKYGSSLLYNQNNNTFFLTISCLYNNIYIKRNDELQNRCSYKSQLEDSK